MAWFDRYDRSYAAFEAPGYGFGTPFYGGALGGWGAYPYGGYWGAGYGYDPEYTYRRSPERSPTYGRGGDEAARRYARSHGYDAGYAVRPGRTGGYARRTRRYPAGYNRGYRGRGTRDFRRADYDRGYRR